MKAYRIGSIRHPIWDGTGAALIGARWNSLGRGVIYAAETYSGALLEVLVRMALFTMPTDSQYVEIDIPADLAMENIDVGHEQIVRESFTKSVGDEWLTAKRTAVLMVPSVVTLVEHNILINPLHPEFRKIQHSDPKPVRWDKRFFGRQL